MRSTARNYLLAVACTLATAIGWAQGRNIGFDWPTTGADAQRTAWLRLDPNISVENFSKPGFEFLWREKLDNAPRQSASLSQGVTMNGLIGFTPGSFVTGASNNVFAIDNDTGYPVWHRKLDAPLPAPTAQCPGGVTGAAGRLVNLVREPLQLPAPAAPGRGYRGGIGAPGEGVPMDIARRDGGAALRGASPIPAARGGGGGVFAGRYAGPIYVVSSNGTLHALGQVSGMDLERPVPFLPPNARYSDLTAIGSMLYTSTSRECGGVANGVWAITLDPKNKTVSSWKTNGGSPVGNLAFTASGRILVAIGPGKTTAGGYANAIVALDAKTLQPIDWFTRPSAEFVTTPVVINHGGREIVAAVTRESIFLLDAASLGGVNHSTPLFGLSGTNLAPDALATFEQPAGTPWLLVPGPNAIVAFRIVQEGGKLGLQHGWTSRDLPMPTAPIIVNDVVFAASSGRPQGSAVLYAFDSRSGRELWNSGKTMTSYVPAGNLWASNSQVHVGTYDGTVYAFGYALERRSTAAQERALPKVVLVGDSIRMGYAPLVTKALVGKAIVVSPTPNGEDSGNVLRNLDEWVIKEKPDVVHINAGLHDLKLKDKSYQVPLVEYERNLKTALERIQKETKAKVIFATTTPILDDLHAQRKAGFDRFEADVQKYNIAALSIMKQAGVPINDLHRLVESGGKEKMLGGDGTHYTPEGYERLAAAVTDSILRSLAQLDGITSSPRP